MKPFQHRLRVRFHEIDRAGIVYFARIFEYCHITYEEMLQRGLGKDLEAHFRDASWGMPLVHADADYKKPLFLGEALIVSLRVARLGEHSVTFAFEIHGAEEGGQLRATASLTHAFVELGSFRSVATPEPFRLALEQLELWPPGPNQ